MALYNNISYLTKIDSEAFNQDHNPGTQPPNSGIYRCIGCGHEVVAEKNRQLPPQNHHQHTSAQGSIRWRMIVYADHGTK